MKNKLVWIIIVVLVIALGVLAFLYLNQRSEMTELVEQMTIEKEETALPWSTRECA